MNLVENPLLFFHKTINRKTFGLIEIDKLNHVVDKKNIFTFVTKLVCQ